MNAALLNREIIQNISRVVNLTSVNSDKNTSKKNRGSFISNKIGDFLYNNQGDVELFKESDLSKRGILINVNA